MQYCINQKQSSQSSRDSREKPMLWNILEEEGGERDYRYNIRYRGGQVKSIAIASFQINDIKHRTRGWAIDDRREFELGVFVLDLNVPGHPPDSNSSASSSLPDSNTSPSLGSR